MAYEEVVQVRGIADVIGDVFSRRTLDLYDAVSITSTKVGRKKNGTDKGVKNSDLGGTHLI